MSRPTIPRVVLALLHVLVLLAVLSLDVPAVEAFTSTRVLSSSRVSLGSQLGPSLATSTRQPTLKLSRFLDVEANNSPRSPKDEVGPGLDDNAAWAFVKRSVSKSGALLAKLLQDASYRQLLLDQVVTRWRSLFRNLRTGEVGKRGEEWLAAQLVLLAFILLGISPLFVFFIRLLGLGVGGFGAYMVIRASWILKENLSPFPVPVENHYLVTSDLYEVVRHPIYGGVILSCVGIGLVSCQVLQLQLLVAMLLVACVATSDASRPLQQQSRRSSSNSNSNTELKASSTDVSALVSSLFDKVNAQLSLKEAAAKTDTFGSWSSSAAWYDETKGSKLTGVSKAVLSNSDDKTTVGILNGWLGPKLFVPHLLLSVTSLPSGKCSVEADYIPRGPTPFGSDDTYLNTHWGGDVLAWHENAYSLPNATPLPPSKSFAARLLRSPAQVAITGIDFTDASEIATKHVTRWLAWIEEGKESEARQRGSLNGRDDKLRMFAFRAVVSENLERFGAEVGKSVGAAVTGPVAEAYIGGGG